MILKKSIWVYGFICIISLCSCAKSKENIDDIETMETFNEIKEDETEEDETKEDEIKEDETKEDEIKEDETEEDITNDKDTKDDKYIKQNDILEEKNKKLDPELIKYGEELKKNYERIFKEYDLDLEIKKYSDEGSSHYYIFLERKSITSTTGNTVSIFWGNDDTEYKEIKVGISQSYLSNAPSGTIKDIIFSTILAVNIDMTEEEAKEGLNKLISTHIYSEHSEVFVTANARIYILDYNSEITELYVVLNDSIAKYLEEPENAADYKTYTQEEMYVILNKEDLVQLNGVVKEKRGYKDYHKKDELLKIETEIGEVYVEYEFNKFPGAIEIGKQYTFYGKNKTSDDDGLYIIIDRIVERE